MWSSPPAHTKTKTGGATKNVAKTTVVLYTRVSSKDQEREGFSIPAQQKLLREYANARGLTILREFVDVETAKQPGRGGFAEMIAFMRATPTCRLLVVEKTDRLYRNFRDYVTLEELGTIHFVKENTVLSPESRSADKLMHNIRVAMAKNYVDSLSEEMKRAWATRPNRGTGPRSRRSAT